MKPFHRLILLLCVLCPFGLRAQSPGAIRIIATPQDLLQFAKYVNAGNPECNARLVSSIDLASVSSQWVPIGTPSQPFRGSFDGAFHPITHLPGMLFGTTDGASISRVAIEGGTVRMNTSYAAHTGSLVGACGTGRPTSITLSYSKANLTGCTSDAGGLVGKMYGSIDNCFFAGTINASSTTGGLVGSSFDDSHSVQVSHSFVYSSTIRSDVYTGAFIGWMHKTSSFNSCYYIADITDMAGYSAGTFSSCGTKTASLFANGSVLKLLNQGQSSAPWSQQVGSDPYPVLRGDESTQTENPIQSLTISPSTLSLLVGETSQLSYSYTPQSASTANLYWWSDNPTIVSVSDSGVLEAKGPGSTLVHLQSIDAKACQAQCQVTVQRAPLPKGAILVNEIQSANLDLFLDPSWNYGGWVELYNTTDTPISLSGFYVSDDPGNLRQHCLHPSVGSLPAHGFLCLWFDHHDRYCLSQVDDKLDLDGGTFYLSDESGQLVLSQEYPPAVARCSYARTTDGGGQWSMCATPTPAASNTGGNFASQRLPAPVPSRPAGFFSGLLSFQVPIPQGATLRYTTDGSTPTLTHGSTNTRGVFSSTTSKVFRFCFFQEGYLPSPVVTATYLLSDQQYTLPIVALTISDANFSGNEYGLFGSGDHGRPGNGQSVKRNYNMDWDRPANIEYIPQASEAVFSQEVDMSASGGWSRASTPHSIKVKASKQYELRNTLDYPFFASKPHLRYKSLLLRNGGNDNTCRIKDAALQEIVRTSGFYVDAQAYEPVCHFINGRYMGVINLRETTNKHYGYANYGYDTDEQDQFEITPDSDYTQKAGTCDAFDQLISLAERSSDPVVYQQVRQLLDVDEYINYMAVQMYLGGTDWPQNNIKGFRGTGQDADGRFHIVLFDLDHAFGTTSPFSRFAGQLSHSGNYNYEDAYTPYFENVPFVRLFLGLLKNPDFVRQFIDSYCLTIGSVFAPERCRQVITDLATRVAPMQRLTSSYGGGTSPWDTANTLISQLTDAGRRGSLQSALKSYQPMGLTNAKGQQVSLSSSCPQATLLVNGIPVPTGHFSGTLYPPVTLTASAPAGYRFVGWSSRGQQQVNTQVLIPEGAKWQYYDRGSLDGKPWTSPSYNVASWSSGAAPLGYGSASSGYATTISYGGNSSNKHTAYYFRTNVRLTSAPAEADHFVLDMCVDDGAVVYVNGREVGRFNMPQGDVTFSTVALTYASNDPDEYSLQIPYTYFQRGDNVVAVEVHNNNNTSSDIYWQGKLSTYRAEYSTDYVSTDSVYALPTSGSFDLVAVYEPVPDADLMAQGVAPVRINEISGANDRYVNELFKRSDWIELYNTTDADIDLSGLYLSDDPLQPQKFQLPSDAPYSTVIPAHGYYVLWADKHDALSQPHTGFQLDKDGGSVLIQSADGLWTDQLTYPAHTAQETIGLYPDGGRSIYILPNPTLAQSNRLSSYSTFFDTQTFTPTGIDELAQEPQSLLPPDARDIQYYTLGGIRIPSPQRGVYIVRYTDASGRSHSRKVNKGKE